VARIGREFARNAERTNGRSMIVMGAGTNHWYHSDLIYRSMLSLVMMCGCQGVNGGGWAHYVGQEKVRPLTGWQTLAFATDWSRPPRHQAATPFWYLATEQWRYEAFGADELSSPLGHGAFAGQHFADLYAKAARMGWLPAYPTFDRNPIDLTEEAEHEGIGAPDYVVRELQAGRLRFAAEDPGAPENFPRMLTLWRSNLLGSSSKGHEYFLRHLLGVTTAAVRNTESEPELRPTDVVWREQAAEAKLDLLVTIDFRMNGSCLHSDVVLPTATWYEKHDISSTDSTRRSPRRGRLSPTGTSSCGSPSRSPAWPLATSVCAVTSSRPRCCMTRLRNLRRSVRRSATGNSASATRSRGARCPN
jgi:nitrate reductase alpha subunit